MMGQVRASDELLVRLADREARIAELEARLAEAEETLQAIRTGEVDALVVSGPDGERIFALEGADHAYRMLVEEMQEGAVTLDLEGLILYSNRQFASMMRAAVEKPVGSHINRFVAPEYRTTFSDLLADAESPRKRCELTLIADDGTSVPVQVSLMRLDTGGMPTVCAVIADRTEQRHYEAMVKDEQLSRLILDQAAEAIIVIDARGTILRASESAMKLTGRNILFQQFDAAFQLWEAESRVDTARLFTAALAEEGLQSVEVKLRHSGRPASTLLLSTGPLWNDAGELLGCVLTLTDITERKGSEESLARQARALERSNYALERSNNDLKQFAYSASHDLREPLRILAIYSQLLGKKYKGRLDEEADEFIGHTVDAAHRMETLLNDLLAYTQAAEDSPAVESPVDANLALAKTLSIFETAFAESGAQVENDPLPMLRVNEVHLQQLFQNLIGNSLKYHGEAPPRIRVSAQPDNGMWRLSVADNGIGIEPQYHAQIFGLFKRLHASSKYAGSGIGLAICHKIVDRYGGRMWVDSLEGKGSEFFFTLPGDGPDANN
jgi:PAS domain S-box-containing protein